MKAERKVVATRVTKHEPIKTWTNLRIGEEVDIKGIMCKLVYVHPAKRRLTFTPVDERAPVRKTLTNPVVVRTK